MPEISSLAPLFIVIYIGFFIFNFGTVMAYLTRYEARLEWNWRSVMDVYAVSFLIGMFSFFALPANFVIPDCFDHGWKLWHGEIRHPRNRWFERLENARENHNRSLRRTMERRTQAGGLCNSIWE